MKNIYKNIFIFILVPVVIIYIYFNYDYISENKFDLSDQVIYGFGGEEKRENPTLAYRMMNDSESLRRIKINGNNIVIPVFCLKPNMNEEPVTVTIFFNNEIVNKTVLNDNDINYIKINSVNMGYNKGMIVNITFRIDRTWVPAEYGVSEDIRKFGIGVGNIEFIN